MTNEAVCLSLLHMDNEPLRIFPWRTRVLFAVEPRPFRPTLLAVDTVVRLLK